MTIIPALERLRQDDWEVGTSLGYIERPCLKNKTKKTLQNMTKKNCRRPK
jgi:hypothetical protein